VGSDEFDAAYQAALVAQIEERRERRLPDQAGKDIPDLPVVDALWLGHSAGSNEFIEFVGPDADIHRGLDARETPAQRKLN
jgi:hypothetical protein